MLPKKPRHIYYALLLLALSIVFSASKANSIVYELIADVTSAVENINSTEMAVPDAKENIQLDNASANITEMADIDVIRVQ